MRDPVWYMYLGLGLIRGVTKKACLNCLHIKSELNFSLRKTFFLELKTRQLKFKGIVLQKRLPIPHGRASISLFFSKQHAN